jgi:hypothetical protein
MTDHSPWAIIELANRIARQPWEISFSCLENASLRGKRTAPVELCKFISKEWSFDIVSIGAHHLKWEKQLLLKFSSEGRQLMKVMPQMLNNSVSIVFGVAIARLTFVGISSTDTYHIC